MSDDKLPGDPDAVRARARAVLEAHWRPEGYTVPNASVYPHQWLWDSCFHAVVWAHLGEGDRALAELRNVFAHQAPDGFVPHLTYWRAPDLHADFWGRPGTSTLTQPPMYGHALAELARRGVAVDDDLVDAARRGLAFLADRRARGLAGSIAIVHPWESGCDDSPRWDAWCRGDWSREAWRARKGELVAALEIEGLPGSAVGSPIFEVEAAGFNALVAFNARELATLGADTYPLDGDGLVEVLRRRWDRDRRTFVDKVHHGPHGSGVVRTVEALLAVLVLDGVDDAAVIDDVFAQLRDPDAFGGACGPAQVHAAEPVRDPDGYWRGAAWPQLTYLFWVAARRLGRSDDAAALAHALVAGATASGFAEYWHPVTGAPGGAAPQSWTALAAVVAGGATR